MFPTRRITTLGGDKFRDEYSLAFDGSDECIELSGTFNYNVHSISCWFKPTALAGAATLFDQRDTNNDGILLFLTDGDLNYQIDNDAALVSDIKKNTYKITAKGNGAGSA